MYELLFVFACLVVPLGLVIALIVWLVKRADRQTALSRNATSTAAFRALIERWVVEQRLTKEEAAPVLRLLVEQPLTAAQPAPVVVAPKPVEAVASTPAVAPQAAPVATPIVPTVPAAPALAVPPARPAAPSLVQRAWTSVLALRTRQLLLFLGAFLLLMSSLVLVIFNWKDFPPLLQCALLASVCGALWGLGELAERRWKVPQAAAGLRAVSGVLLPVVAFAITRLLQIELHSAWLLASLLSLPLYVAAAWRTNTRLFGVAAGLAGASAVLAACGFVSWPALPAALCVALAGYLLFARRIHPQTPEIAQGLRLLAHSGVPAALCVAGALVAGDLISLGAFAAALWSGALFYLVATGIERRVLWSGAASGLTLIALYATLDVYTNLGGHGLLLGLLGVMAAYLLLAHGLRQGRWSKVARGPWVVAHAGAPLIIATMLPDLAPSWMDATMWWALAAFYGLALLLERRERWLWPMLGIMPIAFAATGAALAIDAASIIAGLGVLAFGYAAGGTLIEPKLRSFALPSYVVGSLLAVIIGALALLDGSRALQLTLPLLLAICALFVAATHRGRLGWFASAGQSVLAVVALVLFALLLPVWLWELLDGRLETAWRALALLPLAAAAFAAARWWPGTLRRGYVVALRSVAVALALIFTTLTLNNDEALLAALVMLTATWAFQTLLQRHVIWAFLALGTAVLAAAWALAQGGAGEGIWLGVGLLFTLGYTLVGERARGTVWRCLVAPGTLIGAWVGALLLTYVLDAESWAGASREAVATVLALSALAALHSSLWRRPWLGYLAAPLLALGVWLAASHRFFLPWPTGEVAYAFVLCGLCVTLVAIGEIVRRIARRFAQPYEQIGFALLAAAPLLAGTEPRLATLTWAMVALLSGFAMLRYRLDWALLPALLATDAAILFGTSWLAPASTLADAGPLLVGAAWVQGLVGAFVAKQRVGLRVPAYLALVITGTMAIVFAASAGLAGGPLTFVALGLAALAALLGTWERQEVAAWGTLGLLALGLASLHAQWGIPPVWSASYGTLEALVLLLVGWAYEVLAKRVPAWSRLTVWRRPLCEGSLLSAFGLVGIVVVNTQVTGALLPLIFALITLASMLATAAVQRRAVGYAYGAGAALVGAAGCQLALLNVRELQWYIVPSSLYLLVLAEGLRRFQGRRRLSQLVECGALALLLGTSVVQAVQAEGYRAVALTTLLCAESLLLLTYGVLRRLRVPFVGGAAAFVFGVLWLGIDPLLAQNKWVLMGLLGLALVGLYVLLERRQEQLVRAGRAWLERVSAWS